MTILATQFPSVLRDDLTLVEVAGNNPSYTVLKQSIPATDTQYVVPSVSTSLKTDSGTSLPILAVVSGASGTFTVDADYTSLFVSGVVFKVANSSGNDGSYTVASSTLTSRQTVITVTGTIPSGTVNGFVTSFSAGRDGGTRYTISGPNGAGYFTMAATNGPDNWYGYVRNTLGGASFNAADPSTALSGFVAGYQVVNVGGAHVAADATSLVGATTYTASVLVDGAITIPISILGSNAATYGALITQLNSQLGNDAVAALVGGNVRITSAKKNKGAQSAVAITAGTLFAAPLAGFVALLTAVPGVGPVDAMTFNKLDAGANVMAAVLDTATFNTPVTALSGAYIPA